MKKLKYTLGIIFTCLLTLSLNGQSSFIEHFSDQYNGNLSSPAMFPKNTVSISLPGISIAEYYTGPTASHLFQESDDGSYLINLEDVLDYLEDENRINIAADIPVVGLAIRANDWVFSGAYKWRLDGEVLYAKSLMELYVRGNEPFIDQDVALGPDFLLQAYHEVSLGIAKALGRSQVGVRVKFLSGVEAFETEKSQLSLYTDPEIYALTFTNDFLLNSSGSFSYVDLSDVDFDFESFNYKNFLGANPGIAVDLGLITNLSDKLELSLQVLDLGKISWDNNVDNYQSKGTIEYDGIDLLDYIRNDEEIVLEDSLYNLLEVETTHLDFETKINRKVVLSARYKVNELLQLYGGIRTVSNIWGEDLSVGLGVKSNLLKDRLILSGQYLISDYSASNIGIGIGLDLEVIQISLMSDNIISIISPGDTHYGHIGLGLALGF